MKIHDCSRRELFRRFGASALLLYPILSARSARGDAAAKKRFFVMSTCSGVIQSAFWPTGNSASYSLAGTSLEPLAGLVPNLTIAQGVFNDWGYGDSHSAGAVSLLTGNGIDASASNNGRTDVIPGNKFAYNASIDQMIAASVSGQTPLSSLALAIQPTFDRPSKYISYAANGTYIPQSTNPYTTFASIFQPLLANCATSAQQTAAQTLMNLQARRKSVLDALLGDLNDAARLSGLSAAEKAKYDAYAASLNQIEKTLQSGQIAANNPACTTLAPLTAMPQIAVNNQNYAQVARLMLDLVIAAFQLDVTRVASVVWDVGGNNGVPSIWETYNGAPIGEGYHDLTHQADPANWREKCAVLDKYHAGEFAYLLNALKASPDGASTILDNSLALWTSELGDGAAHNGNSIPIVLAGSAAGAMHTGRYLQFGNNPNHQGVLVAILQAMGINAKSIGNSGTIAPLI